MKVNVIDVVERSAVSMFEAMLGAEVIGIWEPSIEEMEVPA